MPAEIAPVSASSPDAAPGLIAPRAPAEPRHVSTAPTSTFDLRVSRNPEVRTCCPPTGADLRCDALRPPLYSSSCRAQTLPTAKPPDSSSESPRSSHGLLPEMN